MSRRRFGQLQLFNFEIGNKDVPCDILDELIPICLIEAELSMQEVSHLFDILMRQKHLLDHHTVFLECTVSKPSPYQPDKDVITMLPEHECIVHCQLERGQKLHVLQPRFERGKVSKCVSNALQLSVYVRSNILLFLPGQIEIHDIFENAPCGRIPSVRRNDQRSFKSHVAKPTTAKTELKTANFFPIPTKVPRETIMSLLRFMTTNNLLRVLLRRRLTTTKMLLVLRQLKLMQQAAPLKMVSPCHSTSVGDFSKENGAVLLQESGIVDGRDRSKGKHAKPDMLLHEPYCNQDFLFPSKEHTIGRQNTSLEPNEEMQVDDGAAIHVAGNVAYAGSTTSLAKSHQPDLISNAGVSLQPDPPRDDALIPASPGESLSGIETSQRSTDTVLLEQVYHELQQQFDDAKAKEQGSKVPLSKQTNTDDQILEKKISSRKKPCESRQRPPRKPVSKAVPKRGDGLSHCLSKANADAQQASSGAASRVSASEILRNKRRQAHLHTLKQMVSQDVSLQHMDFQEEDLQRAISLYENLNATACFYTAALRIVSKANWNKQVSFENHIGHQAMVAVAKGWTCASCLPNDDFDQFHLALAMSTSQRTLTWTFFVRMRLL